MPQDRSFMYSRREEDVLNFYGAKNIFKENAAPGDVIFSDTSGIHRGEKPKNQDRIALFINYGIIPEYGKRSTGLYIAESIYSNLSNVQKRICKYIDIKK